MGPLPADIQLKYQHFQTMLTQCSWCDSVLQLDYMLVCVASSKFVDISFYGYLQLFLLHEVFRRLF